MSVDVSAPGASSFHLMAKPYGPACNLDCTYCFDLEKEVMFPRRQTRRMTPEVLEAYIRSTIAATPAHLPVLFPWQGGEPALRGIAFFQHALKLQRQYGNGRLIENSFQTNGTLIDEEWARFLAEHGFLVGLSLDGPEEIHDRHRRYRNGAPSHHLVMAALERLQRHRANYNVLACVDAHSSRQPFEVYRFFKQRGVEFIQFTPVVERVADGSHAGKGFEFEGPGGPSARIAPFSVGSLDWGRFLAAVFEDWRRTDVGSVFVMNFEWSLAALMDHPGVVCVHQKECGRALIVEHNGDVYSCDHYVYPEYRLGNLRSDGLAAMIDSTRQLEFGRAKHETLSAQCRSCAHLQLCWGGCPKHRFLVSRDGEAGQSYLCEGYVHYLGHVTPWLNTMAALLRSGRDASEIMRMQAPRPPEPLPE
jgi:uncharacterized protein